MSFLAVLVLLISCATPPKAGPEPEDGSPDYSLLPPGANLYLWADVARARPILDIISFEGLRTGEAAQVLDRTDTALAAFYPEGAPRRFFLAGWGNYPNLRAGFSMSFSRGWKRVKSETGNRYWHSGHYNLGVALGSRLAIASDGDPFAPGSSQAPSGFEEFRRQSVLSLWLNNPEVSLGAFMESMGIPLQIPAQDFFLGIVRLPIDAGPPDEISPDKAEPWQLVLRIRTQSAAQARSVVSLISMARLFIQRGLPEDELSAEARGPLELAALLFANPPEQDGDALIIRTAPLGAERVALLFDMFSLH